jgi:branched-chain amino acid transport system permease protein
MQFFIQNTIVGIAVGGIYALIAIGFVLIYKSTGILNVAQGGLMAIGAFICYGLVAKFGIPFVLAVLITLVVSFLFGILTDRLLFRPMIGQPLFSAVMMTMALLFILEGGVMSTAGAYYYNFPQIFPDKPVMLASFVVSYELLFTFSVAAVLCVIFILFFRFSRTGIKMRAVANDQQAAQASGVKVKRIFALSWGIGAMIASLGGICLGMITMVFYGLSYNGLKVLPIVILGGLESVPGAIVGGLIIGVLESLAGGYVDPYLKGSKEIVPFVVLILILLIKPYGLFGLRDIERI